MAVFSLKTLEYCRDKSCLNSIDMHEMFITSDKFCIKLHFSPKRADCDNYAGAFGGGPFMPRGAKPHP